MRSDGGKRDARRPGKGYGQGFGLIRGKLDDPLKCERCGARLDEDCVCMPTDDGPDQGQDQVNEQQEGGK